MNITLKELKNNELPDFWNLAFSDPNAEWTKWNGPYFNDKLPTKESFLDTSYKNPYLNDHFH